MPVPVVVLVPGGFGGVCVLFGRRAREGSGGDRLQASPFPIQTWLFMGTAVTNCMQPYTIENSQLSAGTTRAFVSPT